MTTKRYTFTKQERLSWKRHIDLLFAEGSSFVAFPLRVIFLFSEEPMPVRSSILISVPKKKFKRAVKRNRIKRLVRENYRLQKEPLIASLEEKDKHLLVAFLFIDQEEPTFQSTGKAMSKAIRILQEKIG
ncbi:ribonuclease P protein component [Parabacteroides sp. PFB2-10]|uniref:ribonuclease P protein component n=1 Tax=Parabacteroides sp. PFB2-10 TaxID=1742405 RepID=UPI00247364E7|nr:ribonuclease P protein component [Parabacteroides sp. PFB2-10]MDH6313862.1 ribonuclease P protein component [Parabacteroides sp. PFB2-10]MDL2244929.1 ribonuclease P protein component [Parabacteroides sp. OttesenSCG-928-J18]